MARLRDESGYTLVELLTSMIIGIVVILAAWMIVDASGALGAKTQARVDAYQRGRLALDEIAGELRSQVCLPGAVPPIIPVTSGPNDVWFYSNTGDQDALPQKRHIYLSGGAIKEETWKGTGSAANPQFNGVPTTRTLVDSVVLVPLKPGPGNVPFLTYYGFDANLPASVNKVLSSPVVAADAPKVVQVNLSFMVRPTGAKAASNRDSTFQQAVYFRTADPTDPAKGPKCQ
jgi:Prokaryotic N-terminal methylation motif